MLQRATSHLPSRLAHVDVARSEAVRDTFRLVLASEWKLGEARFSAVESGGLTEFRGTNGRPLGRAYAFTLADLRVALVQECGARRGWLRLRKPLNDVAQVRIDGEQVAVRLEESATRTALHVEFLVPRDEVHLRTATRTLRFSI